MMVSELQFLCTKKKWWKIPIKQLTDEQKVAMVFESWYTEGNDGECGGHTGGFVIRHGRVYAATTDHDGEPDLTDSTLKAFLKEHWPYFEEEFLEMEGLEVDKFNVDKGVLAQ
ncbi:hypothetical protein LCGC14_2642900 [marine sediment metagenome]|uniref:Uncharacterized protein n=1 Tax=marine sediment metagenome TaxID=412755 RepID=A0A0F8ZX75_9ZZZZ